MYRSKNTLPLAVAFAFWAGASNADEFTDMVVSKFQELGFEYIEVKEGISQLKVEAVQGNRKMEVIYDRSTGKILKQETERADADEIGRSGVDIDRRNRDFLDSDEMDDDENDESDDDENDESDEGDESSESDESDDDEDDDSDESDESGSDSGSDSDEDDED